MVTAMSSQSSNHWGPTERTVQDIADNFPLRDELGQVFNPRRAPQNVNPLGWKSPQVEGHRES